MADIQTLLKNILSAVYGKDVRQSIHDAIHQCYEDGKAGQQDLIARENVTQLSNPNLLLNGDFRNVVNQRKQTIYTSTNSWNKTYTIDRWCIMSGVNVMSVNVNSDSITITTGKEVGHFRQPFEFALPNDNYTITINVLNLSGSVAFHTDNSEKFVVQKGINVFKVKDLLTYVNILMEANSSIEIEYIKLERGNIATPFVPRFFSEEMALCKRFYMQLVEDSFILVRQRYDNVSYYQGFFFPVEVRRADSITYESKTHNGVNLTGILSANATTKGIKYFNALGDYPSVELTKFVVDAEIY